MCHKYNNAFMFSVFSPSTTVKTKMKFPYGAPILDAYDAVLEDGYSVYNFPKAEHRECRVFVEQNDGIVGCCEVAPVSVEYRRRIKVTGLKNATVRFLAEEYCKNDVAAVSNSDIDFYNRTDKFETGYVEIDGVKFFEARNVTGELVLSMPYKK